VRADFAEVVVAAIARSDHYLRHFSIGVYPAGIGDGAEEAV
jgi:hypothetical protein